MKNPLAYASLVLGLTLVASGMLWNRLVPEDVYWSEEDQTEFDEATISAHAASSKHSHTASDKEVPSLEEAKERLEASRAKLSWARTQRNYLGKVISIAGVVFMVAGVAVLRQGDD